MSDLKPRRTTVVLFQGDDLDPIAQRLADVQRLAASSARRIGDPEVVGAASKSYDEFMDEATVRAVKVDLEAAPRKRYRALRNKHPVRMIPADPVDGTGGGSAGGQGPAKMVPHEDDEPWGFNFETFGDAVLLGDPTVEVTPGDGGVPPAIVRVYSETDGVAPDCSTPDKLEAFLDGLADTEFSKLFSEAVMLNQGSLPDPKVRLSSLLDLTSGETSESPARLG